MALEGRLWVRLTDARDLVKVMTFKDHTVRSLGDAVDAYLLKHKKIRGSSRPVIGHLRSGKRNTCRPETARAIEEVLGVPEGFLFVAQMSRVSRPQRTAA